MMNLDALAVPLCILLVSVTTCDAKQCIKPPPGVAKMFRGVDISELDLRPLRITGMEGYKDMVVSYTCDEGRVWLNDGVEYELPDQVNHMTTLAGGWLSADVQIFKSSSDVRKSLTNDVGGEGPIWKFAFSASQSFKAMQNTITNTSRYISDSTSFDSASRVDLIPDWRLGLHKYAQEFLDRFVKNSTYEADPSKYQRFIDYYGTHYFHTANYGGFIRVLDETDTSYFSSNKDQDAKRNAKASFHNIISPKMEGGSSSAEVDADFKSASSQKIKYYGGKTNLLSSSGTEAWQPTVADNPWLYSGDLQPISNLIFDDVQRVAMETAVTQHVLRSYLGELRRLLASVVIKVGDGVEVNALSASLTEMEALPLGDLVQADVETLANQIESQLVAPAWFTSQTKLCYKWRADGDSGQCGGGAGELLCALPGAMTPEYQDDTDIRPGGCRMQWSIQSAGYESWFSDVQICYRWYADGDGGQCGGGADKELCAPINNYTDEYRDNTDVRRGGCKMSWRLVVPDTAPVWFQVAQLCFSWRPDGAKKQCGGAAVPRDMCASANQWTPYYRDDTDVRSGGCLMSWGLKLNL